MLSRKGTLCFKLTFKPRSDGTSIHYDQGQRSCWIYSRDINPVKEGNQSLNQSARSNYALINFQLQKPSFKSSRKIWKFPSLFNVKIRPSLFVSDWMIALGFNNMSTLVSHFVSSPREREKRDSRWDDFFFFLDWGLWPFQEYFTYIQPIVQQRWAKTGEPGEKPTDHP